MLLKKAAKILFREKKNCCAIWAVFRARCNESPDASGILSFRRAPGEVLSLARSVPGGTGEQDMNNLADLRRTSTDRKGALLLHTTR